MGSNFLKQSLGLIGANPDQHPALTPAERVLRGAGEGAASVMLPEAAVGALGDKLASAVPKTADFLENTFGSAKSLPGALTNAGVGAASGFGSAAAGELPVPDSWKPLAEMGGGLLGGGIGALSAQVPTLARQGFDAAGKFIAPMTNPGAVAGARLAEAAGSKDALLNALEDNRGVVLPGSVPTLAEQTQIPGIAALQHQIETKNGVPFQERRAAQNQARVGALTGLQPTGSPEDVASFLRSQLEDLDQRAEGMVAQRTGAAQAATGELGGVQSPEFYGAQITGQVQPQIDAATAGARGANQGLGDYVTPEQSGAQLRGAAQSADEATNQKINALYDAVNPHGTLNTVVAPLRQKTVQIAQTVNRAAGDEMTPDENRLFQAASSFPDVIPFNTLRAFDRNVTAAMSAERAARGKTGTYARLVQLKNATQDAIQNGVANQIAYERQAVARGEIAPEDTVESRLSQNLQNKVADWYAQRNAGIASGTEGYGANTGGGSAPSARISGTAGSARGRSGSNASAEGIPQQLVPNFDEAAADRLETAKQAYAAYAQSKDGLIKNILKDNGFKGQTGSWILVFRTKSSFPARRATRRR